MISPRPPCPLNYGNNDASERQHRRRRWVSQTVLFGWAYPLLKLGLERPIEEPDLPALHELETSEKSRTCIETIYRESCNNSNNSKNSFGIGLFKDYIRSTKLAQALLFFNSMSRIMQALALGFLMEEIAPTVATTTENSTSSSTVVSETSTASYKGYIWVSVMVGCGLIAFPTKQRMYFELYRKGMQYRIGLVAALYHKTLRLPSIVIGSPVGSTNMIDQINANATATANSNANYKGESEGEGVDDHDNDDEGEKEVGDDNDNDGDSDGKNNNNGNYKNDDTERMKPIFTPNNINNNNTTISTGHLANLASNDVDRFLTTSISSIYLFFGPLEAIVILALGIWTMGSWSFASGFCLMVFFLVPCQFHFSKKFASIRSKVAKFTDSRISVVSQSVVGARIVKMNGWELEMETRIKKWRDEEVACVQHSNFYKAWNEAIFYFMSITVAVCIFVVHVFVVGLPLSSRQVFTTLSLLNMLQFTITKHIPNAIMGLSECSIASRRIQMFLNITEHQEERQEVQQQQISQNTSTQKELLSMTTSQATATATTEYAISLVGVTCYWNNHVSLMPSMYKTGMMIALDDVNLSFTKSGLHCIIGKVGSGKSALLQALAGELPIHTGRRRRMLLSSSRLGYATQEPWIMDGTIRENIIMGLPFDQNWYNKVVDACSLRSDLDQFLRGDMAIVGDRGVQCSGGQRARIALARVFYDRNARILLLDDPLSAVDTKVGARIFYRAIQDLGVRENKCVILVTHQHQFVGDSKSCTLLDQGKVICNGSFSDCVEASNGEISQALQILNECENNTEGADTDTEDKNGIDKVKTTNEAGVEGFQGTASVNDSHLAERRRTGIVHFSTWVSYMKAIGGLLPCIAFFASFSLTQTCFVLTSIEIGKWSELPLAEQNSSKQLGLVLALLSGTIVSAIVRAQFSFRLFLNASCTLHQQMIYAVLRAKIEFFDTNPLGRIINRFAADTGISDETLPLTVYDFSVGCFVAFASVAISAAVLPLILVAIPPLILVFLRLRTMFVTTTCELKRLEGMARSPIFSMISEALIGISTTRSNNKIEYMKLKFQEAHNAHSRAVFAFIASSRWFATQMEILAFTLMGIFGFASVLFNQHGWLGEIDPAVFGVALTMLLQMTGTNFPWIVRQSAEVMNQMVSIERVLEYGSLPQEAALTMDSDDRDYSKWPEDTSIVVDNLSIRYRSNLPLALNAISFQVMPRQRVGVVGRTGSGKSSLLQALFRILEAEIGTIYIGGIDISMLGLHTLRTGMSVIPQTPILFSGCSIRENLDPFGKFNESQIRAALESVNMMKTVHDLPGGLDSEVAEGGNNLSSGQRQLLCLSRSILLQKSILILDEPTSNVDVTTDRLLQETLKSQFSDATVISVAHRLDTIIDYDMILVLGDGRVQEFGSPYELLSKGSAFASMVHNTGHAMSKILTERARLAALDRIKKES